MVAVTMPMMIAAIAGLGGRGEGQSGDGGTTEDYLVNQMHMYLTSFERVI
jgi:hypothetical protein